MTTNESTQPDYELHMYPYQGHAEIRAIYHDAPERIIASFDTHDAARMAWDMMMPYI